MSFLNTPKKFWKQIFIGQESNEGEGRWVTIHGNHIFIKEGESIEDAVNYLKIKEFNKNYHDKVIGYWELNERGANLKTYQEYLDKNINKPLKEGYENLPKFYRGSHEDEILEYLRTGKFQSNREKNPIYSDVEYTSLTLSPSVAYKFASDKNGVVVEFESDEVKAKGISEPTKYLQYGYKDNIKKIQDGAWGMAQGALWISEAEIKARNLRPSPRTLTVYTKNPSEFYDWMKKKYMIRYGREPSQQFIKNLNSIKLRSLNEFKKKYLTK